ncbi:MAG: PSD1 domain-containing protein [Planctomycetaceae bacterium]|nr:PSD1 domain-containing protein [Planctomycetales bacterium]MCB9925108.1 PSD1 domain-containing protein [Planctomycetaceae bacterium]
MLSNRGWWNSGLDRAESKNAKIRQVLHALCAIVSLASTSNAANDDGVELFEKQIRPTLIKHCYECHSLAAAEPGGGLLLDSRDSIRKGGESGPAVVPYRVADSLLVEAIRHQSLEMPPKKKLDEATIDAFIEWIEDGAVDPRDKPADAKALADEIWEVAYQSRKQWWSFQPLATVVPPAELDRDEFNAWSASPIDRFLLAKLDSQKITPAPKADRATLIRRLAFTLTGLPPVAADIDSFVKDRRADSWEHFVDKYLASEHFGERFARHWMDVVRYSDTYGYEWDVPAKGAWRYRDYLIRAFNTDVPYDQLIREQLAGDLLETPRLNHELGLNESLIGPMFYHLGEHRHGDSLEFEGIHQEMIDNKIDAFSKAFQGITIACARCHDHKLDPISQQEYYALAGVLMSSRWISRTIDLPERNAVTLSKLRSVKAALRERIAEVWRADVASNITPPTLDSIQPPTALPIGDINYPWHHIHKLEGAELGDTWNAVRQQLAVADQEANAFNRANFELLVDFSRGIPDDWNADGVGLEPVRAGDFQVLRGEDFIQSLFLPGVATSNLSSKLNGALRSPLLHTLDKPFVSIFSAGNDLSAFRRVVDNAFLCEKQKYFANSNYHWTVESTFPGQGRRRIFFEFATKTSNPNFPPRWGLGTKLTDDMIADPNSWFAVNKIYASEKAAPPKKRLSAFLKLLDSGHPRSKSEAAELYRRWLVQLVEAWRDGHATEDEILVLNNLLQTPWVTKSANHPELQTLVDEYRRIESQVEPPRTVNGMVDHDIGMDYALNIRGSYYDLGDTVPRGYLRLIEGEQYQTSRPEHSGRLRLAGLVADAKNPLTARVYVNRVWHWMFGQGIVDTPDNFGKLGGQPSHPELLDWLANRFIEQGWSTKKLVREILLTQAWQQSGRTSHAAIEADPTNRSLHHFATRRLDAECVGDAMLAVSGRFNPALYGAPHNPFRTAEDETKRLFSGPVEGDGRRMLYTKVTIMEPSKFLATFNQPEPKIPTGRREVADTPTQALTLLNHPFVLNLAKHWGLAVTKDGNTTPEARLEAMLSTAFSRSVESTEINQWTHTLHDFATLRNVTKDDIMANAQLWTDVAHTIFNCKEFIYLK